MFFALLLDESRKNFAAYNPVLCLYTACSINVNVIFAMTLKYLNDTFAPLR